jgi:CheY-like chemotaxis protein
MIRRLSTRNSHNNVKPKAVDDMLTILVAEDEPDISELLTISLEFSGYNVITARNGAEAVERAQHARPDLILLDVRMPVMTGYEACEALKQTPDTANIPIIFLSAKGQDAEVNAGLRAGGLDYILKPFAVDRLLARVREVLEATAQGETPPGSEGNVQSPTASTRPSGPRPAGGADDASASSQPDTRPLHGRAGSKPAPREPKGSPVPTSNGHRPHRNGTSG